MKKCKKTYGVAGMMEYQAIVRMGKATMKVPFSDGSMTAMGVNPATFTTEDFMTQHAIEHSSDFKRGRIFLLKTIELEGDVDIRKPVTTVTNAAVAPQNGTVAVEAMATPAMANMAPVEAEAPSASEPSEEKELQQVNVTCNDDAKDYLEDNFGVVRSKLKNRADIGAVAANHGIEFVYD